MRPITWRSIRTETNYVFKTFMAKLILKYSVNLKEKLYYILGEPRIFYFFFLRPLSKKKNAWSPLGYYAAA